MAYILTSGAVLRLLTTDLDDPLVAWIEGENIRPFLTTTTMAQTLDAILTSPEVEPKDRRTFQRRYEALRQDMESAGAASVIRTDFDLAAAEILADLLSIDIAFDVISELDLVPAAIALQHNLALVVTNTVDAWEAFATAIANETGRLTLKAFPTPDA